MVYNVRPTLNFYVYRSWLKQPAETKHIKVHLCKAVTPGQIIRTDNFSQSSVSLQSSLCGDLKPESLDLWIEWPKIQDKTLYSNRSGILKFMYIKIQQWQNNYVKRIVLKEEWM